MQTTPAGALQVSFNLHILHIDESTARGLGPEAAAAARASVAAAAAQYVRSVSGTGVSYHCVPLEAVFEKPGSSKETEREAGEAAKSADPLAALAACTSSEQQPQRLQSLLGAVRDRTGRSDLARHLRTHLLLLCAAALGCSRVARGDCATTLATHIVAAASKGCGYSLPGDVQLLDARSGQAGGACAAWGIIGASFCLGVLRGKEREEAWRYAGGMHSSAQAPRARCFIALSSDCLRRLAPTPAPLHRSHMQARRGSALLLPAAARGVCPRAAHAVLPLAAAPGRGGCSGAGGASWRWARGGVACRQERHQCPGNCLHSRHGGAQSG